MESCQFSGDVHRGLMIVRSRMEGRGCREDLARRRMAATWANALLRAVSGAAVLASVQPLPIL